jgi:hypothetical protein
VNHLHALHFIALIYLAFDLKLLLFSCMYQRGLTAVIACLCIEVTAN